MENFCKDKEKDKWGSIRVNCDSIPQQLINIKLLLATFLRGKDTSLSPAHLWDEAVQVLSSVFVGRVCGEPLWQLGLPLNAFCQFHLLPKDTAGSDIHTSLRTEGKWKHQWMFKVINTNTQTNWYWIMKDILNFRSLKPVWMVLIPYREKLLQNI